MAERMIEANGVELCTEAFGEPTDPPILLVMGLGGSFKYALHGMVDIRLAMIILAGSLFGIQLGAIGTTYVKPYMIKIVMGTIMVIELFSRAPAGARRELRHRS